GWAEGCAAVCRIDEPYWRLDVGTRASLEDEPRPTHVNAILKRATRVRVNRNPLLVIERRRRGSLIDECWGTPSQIATTVEGAFINGYRVRWTSSVEAKTRIENVTLAVERDGGVAARIVLAAHEAFHTRDEGSDLGRIGGGHVVSVWIAVTAPGRTPIVRKVRARVTVAECATRCSINGAGPSARYVVIRPANDPIGIIRINGDRRFVLRRCRGVSVHKDVRRDNRGAIKRAG